MSKIETIKTSWEYRSLRFILRALGVILVLLYLSFSVPGAANWAKREWVRTQPIAAVVKVAEDSAANGNPQKLVFWAAARPEEERQEIMSRLDPYAGRISASTFLMFSEWEREAGNTDKALFWRMYASFRLRFDALRCGAPHAVEKMQDLLISLRNDKTDKILEEKPELVPGLIRQVLDYDATHPAHNNPIDTCPILNKMEKGDYGLVGESEWAAIRHTLRLITEKELGKMNAPAPEKR